MQLAEKKIVVIGVGLIGGSIAKAIKEKSLADEVVGVCRRQSSLDRALAEGAITTGFVNNYAEAVKGASVIFIATPVHTVKENLKSLSEVLTGGEVLVTDAGSTASNMLSQPKPCSQILPSQTLGKYCVRTLVL